MDVPADKAAFCMLTGQTETLQSLSFDGPLAAWQAVALGCLLAGIGFWTLFGIRKDARRKLGFVLFVLVLVYSAQWVPKAGEAVGGWLSRKR